MCASCVVDLMRCRCTRRPPLGSFFEGCRQEESGFKCSCAGCFCGGGGGDVCRGYDDDDGDGGDGGDFDVCGGAGTGGCVAVSRDSSTQASTGFGPDGQQTCLASRFLPS